jgi:AcrR family transcriptional regulator
LIGGAIVKALNTRTRVLDSAERLFAEAGFEGTSLRSITADAEVNLAAVNYHFGSKEALLEAVLARRFAPVNQERLELLSALEGKAAKSGSHTLDVDKVSRALLEPPFRKMREWGAAGQKFMQLVGRTHSDTNPKIQALFIRQFEEVLRRFTKAFERALPDLGPEEVTRRMHFVIGGLAHTLTWSGKLKALSQPKGRSASPNVVLEDLIQFAAAGMAAPVPAVEAGERV